MGHSTEACEGLKREKGKAKVGEPKKETPVVAPKFEKSRVEGEIFMVRTEVCRGETVRPTTGQLAIKRKRERRLEFGWDDPIPPNYEGTEPFIITGILGRSRVHRMYIDGGSSVNIIYEQCLSKLPADIRGFVKAVPSHHIVVGFSGELVKPEGQVNIPLTLEDYAENRKKTVLAEFVVIRAASPYNVILGRTGLLQFQAVASTVHGIMKFLTEDGVVTMQSEPLKQPQVSPLAEIFETTRTVHTISEEKTLCINNQHTDQTIKVGAHLPGHLKEGLAKVLKRYVDVFAWEPKDMTGVPRGIGEHRLNVNPSFTPVQQKKRPMARERNDVVNKEVKDLVAAGVLRPTQFPKWVANPVLVKKEGGALRMCVDFKDLNRACPKDSYPLPEIEQKVEALGDYKWKSFLDAYKGYHQIQMAKEDEDFTAFHTEKGTFCYTKMPFGLRNAGATYQRLMDRVFDGQIGRNVEAYVDDMVIKSKKDDDFLGDIQETLDRLRGANIKLNPRKCTFGAQEGKFLGHIITAEGIKANPAKIKAILDTTHPTTLKDVQSLAGKLVALGRFLAKSTEKSNPLIQMLKDQIGKGRTEGIEEARKGLQRLKEQIKELPMLASPKPGEPLVLYLSTGAGAISAALIAERKDKQMPVYFISRTLQDAENNYTTKEKLVLSLVFAARRLRRYFHANPITDLTEYPLRQIMLKPERSGRLAK